MIFQQKKKKDDKKEEEEVLDWWTRFYETLRDMEEKTPKKKKFGLKLASAGDASGNEIDRAKIPRIKVYSTCLKNFLGLWMAFICINCQLLR